MSHELACLSFLRNQQAQPREQLRASLAETSGNLTQIERQVKLP